MKKGLLLWWWISLLLCLILLDKLHPCNSWILKTIPSSAVGSWTTVREEQRHFARHKSIISNHQFNIQRQQQDHRSLSSSRLWQTKISLSSSAVLSSEEEPSSSSSSAASRTLIVILIPAYNEESRLPQTLETYISYLSSSSSLVPSSSFTPNSSFQYEIWVVDDGSTDNTSKVVNDMRIRDQDHSSNVGIPPLLKCVTLQENQGKGGALSRGIQDIYAEKQQKQQSHNNESDNVFVLTTDADGSGDLSYLSQMFQVMLQQLQESKHQQGDDEGDCDSAKEKNLAVVTGNRNYNLLSNRGITRWGFQTVVWILTGGSLRVQDSQCGLKLMTLETAKLLYTDLNLKGWAHDVEVLYRAALLNIPIQEILIEWKDMDGSKVVESGVVQVSIKMLLDVLKVRWEYSFTQNWKAPTNQR